VAAVDVTSIAAAEPFTTKDGSTIRELHHTEAQSVAEARLDPGQATERHYHARTEEIYFVLEGEGEMELDGERGHVAPGDAVLIPPGARHQITAETPLRFLCCCAPPYSHDDTYFD
jgi:mannose-6-phosphate isomerase-like protein (cupin superfamily)